MENVNRQRNVEEWISKLFKINVVLRIQHIICVVRPLAQIVEENKRFERIILHVQYTIKISQVHAAMDWFECWKHTHETRKRPLYLIFLFFRENILTFNVCFGSHVFRTA